MRCGLQQRGGCKIYNQRIVVFGSPAGLLCTCNGFSSAHFLHACFMHNGCSAFVEISSSPDDAHRCLPPDREMVRKSRAYLSTMASTLSRLVSSLCAGCQ